MDAINTNDPIVEPALLALPMPPASQPSPVRSTFWLGFIMAVILTLANLGLIACAIHIGPYASGFVSLVGGPLFNIVYGLLCVIGFGVINARYSRTMSYEQMWTAVGGPMGFIVLDVFVIALRFNGIYC